MTTQNVPTQDPSQPEQGALTRKIATLQARLRLFQEAVDASDTALRAYTMLDGAPDCARKRANALDAIRAARTTSGKRALAEAEDATARAQREMDGLRAELARAQTRHSLAEDEARDWQRRWRAQSEDAGALRRQLENLEQRLAARPQGVDTAAASRRPRRQRGG